MNLNKPWVFVWVLAIIIAIYGFFVYNQDVVFKFYSTYIVVLKGHITSLISALLFGLGLLYYKNKDDD